MSNVFIHLSLKKKLKEKLILKLLDIIMFGFKLYILMPVIFINFNPYPAKLNNLNFHPLEVMSRCRDPQLQVSDNYYQVFV